MNTLYVRKGIGQYFPNSFVGIFLQTYLSVRCPFAFPSFYRVFRKNCVFSQFNATPPSHTYLVRDLQSSRRNASVQSLLLTGKFLNDQQQPQASAESEFPPSQNPALNNKSQSQILAVVLCSRDVCRWVCPGRFVFKSNFIVGAKL